MFLSSLLPDCTSQQFICYSNDGLCFYSIGDLLLEFECVVNDVGLYKLNAVYLVDTNYLPTPGDIVLFKHDKQLHLVQISMKNNAISSDEKLSWSQILYPDHFPPVAVTAIEAVDGDDGNIMLVPLNSIISISKHKWNQFKLNDYKKTLNVHEIMKTFRSNSQKVSPISPPQLSQLSQPQMVEKVENLSNQTSTMVTINDYRTPAVDYASLTAPSVTEDDFMFFDMPTAESKNETPAANFIQDSVQTNRVYDHLSNEMETDDNYEGELPLKRYEKGGDLNYTPLEDVQSRKCSKCGMENHYSFMILDKTRLLCKCELEDYENLWKVDPVDSSSVASSKLSVQLVGNLQFSTFNQERSKCTQTLVEFLGTAKKFSQILCIAPFATVPPTIDTKSETLNVDLLREHFNQLLIDYKQTDQAVNIQILNATLKLEKALGKLKFSLQSIADVNNSMNANVQQSKYSRFNVKRKVKNITQFSDNLTSVCAGFEHFMCRSTSQKKLGDGVVINTLENCVTGGVFSLALPFGGRKNIQAIFIHKENDPVLDVQIKYLIGMIYNEMKFGNLDWLNDVNIPFLDNAETVEKCFKTITPTVVSLLISAIHTPPASYILVLIEDVVENCFITFASILKWKTALLQEINRNYPMVDLNVLSERLLIRLMPFNFVHERSYDNLVRFTRILYNSINITNPIAVPTSYVSSDLTIGSAANFVGVLIYSYSFCKRFVYGILTNLKGSILEPFCFETEQDSLLRDYIEKILNGTFANASCILVMSSSTLNTDIYSKITSLCSGSRVCALVEFAVNMTIGLPKSVEISSSDAIELHLEQQSNYQSFFLSITGQFINSYVLKKCFGVIEFQSWKGYVKDFNDLRLVDIGDASGMPWPICIVRNFDFTIITSSHSL